MSLIDTDTRKTLQKLAREQFKTKMLNDILIDLTICEIEGWSKKEYITELHNLIDDIYDRQTY